MLAYQVAVTCLLVAGASTLEVGVPERFLRPRNFNPHPYALEESRQYLEETVGLAQDVSSLPHPYQFFRRPETRDEPRTSGAPIQFPKVPEAAQIPTQQPATRLNSPSRPAPKPQLSYYDAINDLSQDELSLQNAIGGSQQYREPLRVAYLSRVPQVAPIAPAPPAPAPPPPQQYHAIPDELPRSLYRSNSLAPKNYAFSYAVKDGDHGDDFSHSQAHHGAQTKGEYRVKLPDGRVQVVSYTADDNGYKADVRYDNEENSVEPAYQQPLVKYKPVYKTGAPKHIYRPAYHLQQGAERQYTPIHEGQSNGEPPASQVFPGSPDAGQLVKSTGTPVAIAYAVSSTPQPPKAINGHRFLAVGGGPRQQYYSVGGSSTPAPQYYSVGGSSTPQYYDDGQQESSGLFYPSSTVAPQYLEGSPSPAPQRHNFYFVQNQNQ
ncbi:Insect cuticle protein [Nesidiocoris tenuis]|uniref:Insect cuticle protein n=1 Tax=Nesidiocoris tenuis TaxID=355587 RepID=A0ABN7AAM7_9HEMI|nr:Insect cuticle protein [Nesidiocoris tenuis]